MRQRPHSYPPSKRESEGIRTTSKRSPTLATSPPSTSICVIGSLCIILIFGISAPILNIAAAKNTKNPFLSSLRMSKIQERTSATPVHFKSLRIVSMNLAGCEPSTEAPGSWNQTYVAQVVRQELLKLSDPDVLALQECPAKETWAEQLFEGYKVTGVGTSHAGYVLLLVRDKLAPVTAPVEMQRDLPAVMAQIVDPNNKSRVLNVASCHLAPFAGGANRRSAQIQQLLDVSGSDPLVIAGDTNMRWEEDATMEGTFKLRDAWKEAGEDPATKFTWDTENHLQEGGYFNRYYGEGTREYRTRYDRMYISCPNKERKAGGMEVSVSSFGLVANQPVNTFTKTHFLSDHFGITGALMLD